MVMLKEAILWVLYDLYTKPRDSSGLQRATGEDIQKATNLEAQDINEALKTLDNEHKVFVAWTLGYDPFHFSEAYLKPLGRLECEEKLEEFNNLKKEKESRKRELV